MRTRHPGPQLVQRPVRRGLIRACNASVSPARRNGTGLLGAWRGLAQYTQPGADFGNVGRTDVETRRHLHQGHVSAGEHPIPQVLPMCLPTTATPSLPPTKAEVPQITSPPRFGGERFQSSR
jgi:hypothetical protein